MIYRKATDINDSYSHVVNWGAFTRYIEIGEDLFAVRHVDVFNNGNSLRYDRNNWEDKCGMLVDAKYDAAKWCEAWGPDQASDVAEFEIAWSSAEQAPNQPQVYNQHQGDWPVLRILGGNS